MENYQVVQQLQQINKSLIAVIRLLSFLAEERRKATNKKIKTDPLP